MELNLQNKAALVVASSQGLGKAIALQLVKEGVNVMLTSRSEQKLISSKEEIEKEGSGKVSYFVADITKYSDIKNLVVATRKKFGRIDILINNAGGPPSGNFEDLNDEEWIKSFELNLLSYTRIIREVLPDLKKSGGHIINLASSSVKVPIPGLILSNTFRLGIVGLTKTLSQELAKYNILVNTVAPGRIATDRVEYLDLLKTKKQERPYEEVVAESKKGIPMGRYGEPEEFGKIVTFLVSGVNSYMTGSTFIIDGGMVKAI